MNIQPVILSGRNVKLLPLESGHAQPLFEAGRYPEIWTYTQDTIHTVEDMETYVREALGSEEFLPFAIMDKNSGRLVGSTRLYGISAKNRSVEIGYTWLTPGAWRSSINTESKYLLLKHCFETLGTIRVQFKTDARNVKSQNAISRLGAVKEGVLRNHIILKNGFIRDSVYYSIIDSEWPGVKERLESKMK